MASQAYSQWEGMALNLGHFQEIAQTMLFLTLEVQMTTRRKRPQTLLFLLQQAKNRQADKTAK